MRQLLFCCDNSSHLYRVSSQAIAVALRNGHEDVAWLLLESGATVNGLIDSEDVAWQLLGSARESEKSLLNLALQSQNKPLVQAILNADIGYIRNEDYDEAFKWDDTSIITDLTFAYPPFELESKTLRNLCRRCVQSDKIDFFRSFIESMTLSEEFSMDLTGCLEDAAKMGHSEMICYLLDIGANPFATQVLRAALPDHKGVLHLLFNKSRPRQYIPRCIGASVISAVIDESLDNPQALDALLETRAVNLTAMEQCGSDLDLCGYDAVTPLGWALSSLSETPDENPWAVRALLDAGSDPNGVAACFSGNIGESHTGLMLALETTRHDVIQLLIDSGANINLKPRFAIKRTPLQHAAKLGHLDLVRMLIEQGAEVNAEPAIRSGGTALQFAALSGNCNTANELLVNGALLDALPSKVEGRWPLEAAAENGRLDMIEFLWTAASNMGGSEVVAGFQRRHCLRAMNFAHKNGHMGCRDLISELSGIPVDRLDVENYGAPWLAYSDLSHYTSSSDGSMSFLGSSDEWFDNDNDGDETDEEYYEREYREFR